MRKIGIVLFSVLLALSVMILAFFYVLTRDESFDPEYAVETFHGEIVTKEFEFDAFGRLYFLNDLDSLTKFSKKTGMLHATPVLKIVDSAEYRVEVTTNSDVFDKLKIATADDTVGSVLVITFTDDCYVPVHVDDVEYDYDTGLYVDFDKFEVTVYAPISTLFVDSKIILDYQAPKCNRMYVDFSFEGTDANIYDIDTDELILNCSGTSNITLSGTVKNQSKISIWHNTKVDANNLKMNSKSFYVSSSILGYFSYIKYNNTFDIGLSSNVFSFMLNAFLCLPPILWTVCLIICIRKKRVLARK